MNALEKIGLNALEGHVSNVHKKIVSIKDTMNTPSEINTAENIALGTFNKINNDLDDALNEISNISAIISALKLQ